MNRSFNFHKLFSRWPLKDEPARPTRFEWGDPDDDPLSLNTGPVVSHSLMEKQKASGTIRKAEDIFDAVKTQTLGKRNALEMAKNSCELNAKIGFFGLGFLNKLFSIIYSTTTTTTYKNWQSYSSTL
jgi:hypothetical protein